MNPSTLLIVEDQIVVALDLEERLERNGYKVCGIAISGVEALALARQYRPALALMDIRLQGEMDGIQTAQILRSEMNVPVIFLSAHSDEATLQRAKLTAPYGFLLKPFDERELRLNIEMALYKHDHERQLTAAREDIRRAKVSIDELATRDPLTGLANRRSLAARFEHDRIISERSGVPLSMLLIDIDHFTAINERYGHVSGDVYLKVLAAVLRDCVREIDLVARIGGEAFVVLLPATVAVQAQVISECIRQKVEISPVAVFEGSALMHFTVSIGAVSTDANAQSLEELIRCADEALKRAKNKGRNQVAT